MPRKPPERKFEHILMLCAEAKAKQRDSIIIPSPQTLGDTYQELILSLDRIAQTGLPLRILPPDERAR